MIRTRVPYVGSCGALDMVNFYAREPRENRRTGLPMPGKVAFQTVKSNEKLGEGREALPGGG
jgi:uncharacterized protein (UPF0261 family)